MKADTTDFLVSLIDLTTLNILDNKRSVESLIKLANVGINGVKPASVCLFPKFAKSLVKKLDQNINSCVVAGGFPNGQTPIDVKIYELKYLENIGVKEIDIVFPIGEFLVGNIIELKTHLQQIRQNTTSVLKVILETGILQNDEQVKQAAKLAINSGANFIKTSTGKFEIGATPRAVENMAEVILETYNETGRKVGLKVSGGIKSIEEALDYINIIKSILGEEWMTSDLMRFGSSSLYEQIKKSNGH